MSDVPEKTSTRPSGLILIHACDGSPFWFMPVGYSIAAMPGPCAWPSVSLRVSDLRDEVLGQQLAFALLAGHCAVVGRQLVADLVRDRLDRGTVDGSV